MIELDALQKSFLIDVAKTDVDVESINGSVIGGWVDMQMLNEIAISYLNAANELVNRTSKESEFAYEYAYPIIFLYRHAIELKLKSIKNGYKENHSLHQLRDNLIDMVEDRMPLNLQNSLKERINEFIIIDERGTRFRYGSEPKDELIVDFIQMKNVVKEIFKVVETIEKRESYEKFSNS